MDLSALAVVAALASASTAGPATSPQVLGQAPPLLGPYLGHLGPNDAVVFFRATADAYGPETFPISVVDGTGRVVRDTVVTRGSDHDFTVVWRVHALVPDTTYAFAVLKERLFFKTPREPERPSRVTIAFGSCANDSPGLPNPVWPAIRRASPHALVLLGDTPYIDTTDLAHQRRRYKEFYSNPDLTALMRSVSTYATWDDHDFAGNGADGTAENKGMARQAFLEYHGNPSAGDGMEGIYTRFRRGPIDVFLLDTRWFSNTEPSFADPEKPTLLGRKQWDWLQRELAASTAPFKVLASGMAWNEAVREGKPDHWTAYPHERAALFAMIAEKKIGGVILVGGDLHRSRAFVHPSAETGIPYPVHEWITSPLGDAVIEEAAVPHPALTFDRGEKHAFLLVKAQSVTDPPTVAARFQNAAGEELHVVEVSSKDLAP